MENRLGVKSVAGVVTIERCAMNVDQADAIHLAAHLVLATPDGLVRLDAELERLGVLEDAPAGAGDGLGSGGQSGT